jgi:hypothetical protein
LNYACQKRPPVPITPLEPLDKEFLRESIKELTAILNKEWAEEAESSFEEIRIHIPSSTIHCKVQGTCVDVLYNPSVGANVMSIAFASAYLGEKSMAPKVKSLRTSPRTSLKGLGILHDMTLHPRDMEVALDFHVFKIQDFDIMMGHPLEKLIMEPIRGIRRKVGERHLYHSYHSS